MMGPAAGSPVLSSSSDTTASVAAAAEKVPLVRVPLGEIRHSEASLRVADPLVSVAFLVIVAAVRRWVSDVVRIKLVRGRLTVWSIWSRSERHLGSVSRDEGGGWGRTTVADGAACQRFPSIVGHWDVDVLSCGIRMAGRIWLIVGQTDGFIRAASATTPSSLKLLRRAS